MHKFERVRRIIDDGVRLIGLEVDSGIKVDNILWAADAGADTFVIGSAIYGLADYVGVAAAMRAKLNGAG